MPKSFDQFVQRLSDLVEQLKTSRDPYTRRNLLFEMRLVLSELDSLVAIQTTSQSAE
jgi:hypothetical protein